MGGLFGYPDGGRAEAAGNRAAEAREAVEKIDAAWERSPQPSADDLADHLRSHPIEGEGFSASFRHEEGDVDAALAAGPVRLDAHYTAAYIAHVPLEPRSAVATWRDGHLTVWTGTSTPFRARRELADAVKTALALYGRDVQLDAYLRGQRHFPADWLHEQELALEMARLGEVLAGVSAP